MTSIGLGAFYKCSSLTSITIPNSVTNIGEHPFSGCYRLTSVEVLRTTPLSLDYEVFSGVLLSFATLTVSSGSISAYQSAAPWNSFGTIVEKQ
ncbi:MAG: leucine-rich repeat domain-containing protein [Tannerella sp.]|nr:leucine-rich repeat domain-containing protein [Tannerella sp.]